MVNETEKKLYEIIDQIPITENNRKKITEIKMEGKKQMTVASFLNGNKENLVGVILNEEKI